MDSEANEPARCVELWHEITEADARTEIRRRLDAAWETFLQRRKRACIM